MTTARQFGIAEMPDAKICEKVSAQLRINSWDCREADASIVANARPCRTRQASRVQAS
jgi:hypothetical protein